MLEKLRDAFQLIKKVEYTNISPSQ